MLVNKARDHTNVRKLLLTVNTAFIIHVKKFYNLQKQIDKELNMTFHLN